MKLSKVEYLMLNVTPSLRGTKQSIVCFMDCFVVPPRSDVVDLFISFLIFDKFYIK